jgi:hypothetical protein
MLFAAVEWGKLLQVIWVSLLAGIGVTLVYSLVIYGGARAAEARRAGAGAAATAYGALTALALLVFLAGLAFGVAIILNK